MMRATCLPCPVTPKRRDSAAQRRYRGFLRLTYTPPSKEPTPRERASQTYGYGRGVV